MLLRSTNVLLTSTCDKMCCLAEHLCYLAAQLCFPAAQLCFPEAQLRCLAEHFANVLLRRTFVLPGSTFVLLISTFFLGSTLTQFFEKFLMVEGYRQTCSRMRRNQIFCVSVFAGISAISKSDFWHNYSVSVLIKIPPNKIPIGSTQSSSCSVKKAGYFVAISWLQSSKRGYKVARLGGWTVCSQKWLQSSQIWVQSSHAWLQSRKPYGLTTL